MLFYGLLLLVSLVSVLFVAKEFRVKEEVDETFEYVKTPSYSVSQERIKKLKERLYNWDSSTSAYLPIETDKQQIDGAFRKKQYEQKQPISEESKAIIRQGLGIKEGETEIRKFEKLSSPKKRVKKRTELNGDIKEVYQSWKENAEALDKIRLKMLGMAS